MNKVSINKIVKSTITVCVKYRIFFILGSISIFGSWVFENFKENKFRSEREKIELKQQNVIHMVDARRIWEQSTANLADVKGDNVQLDSIYNIQVYNYIETSLTAIAMMDEILIPDPVKLKETELNLEKTILICHDACKNKDYKKLIAIERYITIPNGFNFLGRLREDGTKVNVMLESIAKREDLANNFYLFFYCLGALFIGGEFLLLNWNKTNPSNVATEIDNGLKSAKSAYLQSKRLADVLALIQVLSLDKKGHRSENGLEKELKVSPKSSTNWKTIALEHPEFFRVDDKTEWSVSLIARHVIDVNENGVREVPIPLIERLFTTAIELYKIEKDNASYWKVWVPIAIAALVNIIVTILVHK